MRIALALLFSSPTLAPLVDFVHVEGLLLLPRNQRIRLRFKALVREYCRLHFEHSDPYAEDEDADAADNHPAVIAARRPITAIEVMLTNGRYQAALANYRAALLRDDREEIERIEQNLADIAALQADDGRTAEPLHAVG